jgi:non-canonical poly(A) RNA polymerase PAPD5/7
MEFFRFVERAMSSQGVIGFPEVGLTYLNDHQPPPDHPHHALSLELVAFIRSLLPTPPDIAVRQQIIDNLCRRIKDALLQGSHENVIVLPCGSCLNGTFLPEADIDLILFRYPTPCHAPQMMEHLQQQLEDLIEPGSLHSLPQARVPVLKFVVDPGIQIDLTIDELRGPLNVVSVRQLFTSFPILLPAQLFLKCLLRLNDLDQPYTGGISSYTLHLLLVAYLQHRGESPYLTEFLSGFCRYYADEFNFTLTGIDVRGNGRLFSRLAEDALALDSPASMHIIDPLNVKNVLGNNAFRTAKMRQVFRETAHAIDSGDAGALLSQFESLLRDFDVRRALIVQYANGG